MFEDTEVCTIVVDVVGHPVCNNDEKSRRRMLCVGACVRTVMVDVVGHPVCNDHCQNDTR